MILQFICHNLNSHYIFIYIWTLIQLLTSIRFIYIQELKFIFLPTNTLSNSPTIQILLDFPGSALKAKTRNHVSVF